MKSLVNKQKVRDSFDRAAATYDEAAIVQRQICDRLIGELTSIAQEPNASERLILDAGCGTGYGATLLQQAFPTSKIVGLDFAHSMLKLARSKGLIDQSIASDIEKLPLASQSMDLWWSSLAIQWCHLPTVFAEAYRVLKPGGILAFSTLGPATFQELEQAFATIDTHRHTLSFQPPANIEKYLKQSGFNTPILFQENKAVHYPNLKALLKAIKAIGAQNVGTGARSSMLGKTAWQKLEAHYEQHRTIAGLPANYDVIFGIATK